LTELERRWPRTRLPRGVVVPDFTRLTGEQQYELDRLLSRLPNGRLPGEPIQPPLTPADDARLADLLRDVRMEEKTS
jgi:hypothetical protein